MTQSERMPVSTSRRAIFSMVPWLTLAAQTSPEDYKVYTDAPRLVLRPQRLRLLRRERERKSMRWEQFSRLVSGKANFPEPGFAQALYYQVAQDEEVGRRAVAWAVGAGSDPRQLALVLDWCAPLLSDAETRTLQTKLRPAISANTADWPSLRNRVWAAVALANVAPEQTGQVLSSAAQTWQTQFVPALKAGRGPLKPQEWLALAELLHAIRDNTNVEWEQGTGDYFKNLPAFLLLSHYPAPYPAPENDYRIPQFEGKGDPDLLAAALSRAAGFAFVAYSSNATEMQFLQGWLLLDRYNLKSTFGSPYEFLWANPYQPGLTFEHLPLVFHNPSAGRLLLRSSWDDDAQWYSNIEGRAQAFTNGRITAAPVRAERFGDAIVIPSREAAKFQLEAEGPKHYFLVGMQPRATYQVEVDDEELREETADPAGVVALTLTPRAGAKVRVQLPPATRS